jgi:hypothetical protein
MAHEPEEFAVGIEPKQDSARNAIRLLSQPGEEVVTE